MFLFQPLILPIIRFFNYRSIHLSNVAIQQNYLNGERSSELPENNFMTSTDFEEYLT